MGAEVGAAVAAVVAVAAGADVAVAAAAAVVAVAAGVSVAAGAAVFVAAGAVVGVEVAAGAQAANITLTTSIRAMLRQIIFLVLIYSPPRTSTKQNGIVKRRKGWFSIVLAPPFKVYAGQQSPYDTINLRSMYRFHPPGRG
jgi:hypothetical protein